MVLQQLPSSMLLCMLAACCAILSGHMTVSAGPTPPAGTGTDGQNHPTDSINNGSVWGVNVTMVMDNATSIYDNNGTNDTDGMMYSDATAAVTELVPTTSTSQPGSESTTVLLDTEDFLRLFREPWFIGVCGGVGAFIVLTGIVVLIAGHRRKVLDRKRRERQKQKSKQLQNNRRSSALHELMGYDPAPDGHAGPLSENDLSTWVASNDQLRLPHIAVNGVKSVPVTSHAHVSRNNSQISMNALLFVKDWGEEFPPDPPPIALDHSNLVLNPVFEEPRNKDELFDVSEDGSGKRLQRRPSQLSLMRKALEVNDIDVDWVVDET